MVQDDMILYIIKLAFGGIAAFLAIMLWSKTRDVAWMSLVAGILTAYAGIVYNMLADFGIVFGSGATEIFILNIPLATLLFAVIPSLFYITAFILMLHRTRQ